MLLIINEMIRLAGHGRLSKAGMIGLLEMCQVECRITAATGAQLVNCSANRCDKFAFEVEAFA